MSHDTPRRSPDPRTVRTRAAILRAAGELFTDEGFEATSVATVARRAGVGISSIYLHFPSKSALVDEIIGAAVERHADAFERARAEAAPGERLLALGRAYLAFAEAEPAAARAIALSGSEPSTVEGSRARDFLEGLVDDVELSVRGLVAAGRLPATALHCAVALTIATILGIAEQVVRRDALAILPDVGWAALGLLAGLAGVSEASSVS
jgi:AcrR family transcriptional regulator